METTMSRHTVRWTATAAIAALALAACGGGEDESGGTTDGDSIVIGMVNDTSGGASAYSPYTTTGVQVAIDEINDAGGIDGQQIELITESDGSDTTQTPTIARRLIDQGADLLLLNSGSASAISAKGVCVEEEVLCVASTNLSADIIKPPNAENIYILGPTSAGIGDAFSAGMKEAGFQRMAVIADDVPTIQGYVPAIAGAITDVGITQVASEKVPADAADVTAQIARIEDADPDVVLVMSLGGQTEAVVQNALHAQLPGVARFSLASIGNQPTTWDLADPGALEGLVYVSSIDAGNPRTTEFAALLEQAGGEYTALTAYGVQGYDSVRLVAEAIEKAGGVEDRAALNETFQQISGFQASYGQSDFTMSFSADKHVGSDGNCGLVLGTFGPDNVPGDPWETYQPTC
jgi:branched-chain amino acid transport system substrate-binding protein